GHPLKLELAGALRAPEKKLPRSPAPNRRLGEPDPREFSRRRPGAPALSSAPAPETALNLQLMRLLAAHALTRPCLGVRTRPAWLPGQGDGVNPTRGRRLLRQLGL